MRTHLDLSGSEEIQARTVTSTDDSGAKVSNGGWQLGVLGYMCPLGDALPTRNVVGWLYHCFD